MKVHARQMANTNSGSVSSPGLAAKVSGYLEKKGRLRIGSQWKKYWFVLEGRLLLYYRSKDEYDAISPCKGSLNLCPPCTIQPASAANCTFQIDCRANIVTLKAQNRSDQERWMQAILAAIDQSKSSSPSRLSHFRYSLDDLPTTTENNSKNKVPVKFMRQNTMPYRLSSSPASRSSGDGYCAFDCQPQRNSGQFYRGSLEAIPKSASNSNELNVPKKDRFYNYLVDNDQYSIIQEEKSMDVRTYEAASEMKPTSLPSDSLSSNSSPGAQVQQKIEHLYERISTDSNSSSGNLRPKNLNVPNNENGCSGTGVQNSQEYALYERITADYSGLTGLPDLVENEQYSVVQKSSSKPVTPASNIDYNKNSLLVTNEQYCSVGRGSLEEQQEENTYADYAAIDQLELYEDPDTFRYVDVQQVEETTSQTSSSNDSKSKQKKHKRFKIPGFGHADKKNSLEVFDDAVAPPFVSKKPQKKKHRKISFLRRMWRKRTKSLDGSDEVVYECVDDYEFVRKQKLKNQEDIEMLEELQKILEAKKMALQRKVMISSNGGDSGAVRKAADLKCEKQREALQRAIGAAIKPSLPPRQGSRLSSPKSAGGRDGVKSIDEILKDLDNEEEMRKTKLRVTELIELFNEWQHREDGVVLRRATEGSSLPKSTSDTEVMKMISAERKSQMARQSYKDSEELNRLLDELAKVTSAPVMTPGVTNSLITPVLTDEEWLKLMPIRKRRFSEPDYDVPRPHSSLQLLERSKPSEENPIPVTRFFGPILPTTTNLPPVLTTSVGIDPDSLETQHEIADIKVVVSKDDSNATKNVQPSPESLANQGGDVDPVEKKSEKENRGEDGVLLESYYKNGETFVDSLEPVAELSTTF